MTVWRICTLATLMLVAGVPLAAPLMELSHTPAGWRAWSELPRLAELARNSLLLAAGTLLLVLPTGTLGAILLFRTDLPGRRLWRFLMILALFVPLPLVTAAWQMALGALLYGPGGTPLGPQGFLQAIAIHSVVALPWVVVVIGLGLSWVEPELEEDALTVAPAWRVLLHVSLPRALPAVLLAGLWTALLTLNEITTITDTLVIRTYGEEVYYQFTSGSDTEVARAVALSMPAMLILACFTWLVLSRWQRVVPPRESLVHGPRLFTLGCGRRPLAVTVLGLIMILLGVPLAGLLWKAGLRFATADAPGPPTWDLVLLLERVGKSLVRQSGVLLNSLLLAVGTGCMVAMTAAWLCWLARGSRWFELTTGTLAAGLWALPGPVLGVGLLATLQGLLDVDPTGLVKLLMWERPSPLPNLWLCTLRYLPVGLAALGPMARLQPVALDEAARLDGATPWQRFSRVFLPALRWPVLWTGLGVGVLCLGEHSGCKVVNTPPKPLAQHVFEQMHYGADSELAALCLVLLLLVVAGGSAVELATRRSRVYSH